MIQKPMLAATLEDIKTVKYPILCTPKLDGIRCLIVNGKAVTRNFKSQPNTFIRKHLENNCFEGFDGELILEGKQFNEISSVVMSEDGEPNFIYAVFDYYTGNDKVYHQRIQTLMVRKLHQVQMVEKTE